MADNEPSKPTRRNARTRTPKSAGPSARTNTTTSRTTTSSGVRLSTTAKTRVVTGAPPAEQVRERAYFIYLERQCAPGDPVADWVRAERELATGKFA